MMKVPFWVISGTSPKKTSCSLMSRIERLPVSASLSKIVRRIVTFSGAEYVMPRSWHSFTSYFSCNVTGSPHLLQNVGVFLLNVPHFAHSTSPVLYGLVTTDAPQFRHVARK